MGVCADSEVFFNFSRGEQHGFGMNSEPRPSQRCRARKSAQIGHESGEVEMEYTPCIPDCPKP